MTDELTKKIITITPNILQQKSHKTKEFEIIALNPDYLPKKRITRSNKSFENYKKEVDTKINFNKKFFFNKSIKEFIFRTTGYRLLPCKYRLPVKMKKKPCFFHH